MLLIRVPIFFWLIKVARLVHLFGILLGPESLEIVDLQLWLSRDSPPEEIDAQVDLGVVEEVTLLSVEFLLIVDIALIIFNGLHLFLNQLVSEENKEDSFYKSQDAHDEGRRVAPFVHMDLGFRSGQ